MDLKQYISVVPDWPKPGVNFLDISGLLADPLAFAYCAGQLAQVIRDLDATSLVAVESRGFLFAAAVAQRLSIPVVLARKKGKSPGACYSHTYATEYSTDTIELQQDAKIGLRPVIVDDLLATGGTILAVNQLIRQSFLVDSVAAAVVINLSFLPGQTELAEHFVDLHYLIQYE
jgi:adenine phosphoribosyltransferase